MFDVVRIVRHFELRVYSKIARPCSTCYILKIPKRTKRAAAEINNGPQTNAILFIVSFFNLPKCREEYLVGAL